MLILADVSLPDWTAIEADYRAGSMSIREVAAFYDVPESTVRKRARKGGWTRTAKHITDAEIYTARTGRKARP